MNAVRFLKEAQQICRAQLTCTTCPIFFDGICGIPGDPMLYLKGTAIEELVSRVEKWSLEHAPTYADIFLEKLPNATIEYNTLIPKACLELVFGEEHLPDFCSIDKCLDCWNRPYPESDS